MSCVYKRDARWVGRRPDAFAAIVPCGLRCSGVTSLAALTGRDDLSLPAIVPLLGEALARRMDRAPRFLDEDAPLPGGLVRPRPGEPDLPEPPPPTT